jgi:hypothetical protein
MKWARICTLAARGRCITPGPVSVAVKERHGYGRKKAQRTGQSEERATKSKRPSKVPDEEQRRAVFTRPSFGWQSGGTTKKRLILFHYQLEPQRVDARTPQKP